MAQIGKKLRSLEGNRVSFMCPGCNQRHAVKVGIAGQSAEPTWMWNGDADIPTFTPSIIVDSVRHDMTREEFEAYNQLVSARGPVVANEDARFKRHCHSFVTNGQIQFCPDSNHSLSGKTVDLPDIT